jgi:ribosomal protein S18 acetylase RimI-like enzyme
MLRAPLEHDLRFISALWSGANQDLLRARALQQKVFIIDFAGAPAGFLQFQILWDTLPLMEVIVIRAELRKQGIGRAAVRAWERDMAKRSYLRTLISTRVDESAQHFWRALGYRDCGALNLPEQAGELFLFHDTTEQT